MLAQFMPVSMLHVDDVDLKLALPIPHIDSAMTWVYIRLCSNAGDIDVIEQVMSNAAIEKMTPETQVQYQ